MYFGRKASAALDLAVLFLFYIHCWGLCALPLRLTHYFVMENSYTSSLSQYGQQPPSAPPPNVMEIYFETCGVSEPWKFTIINGKHFRFSSVESSWKRTIVTIKAGNLSHYIGLGSIPPMDASVCFCKVGKRGLMCRSTASEKVDRTNLLGDNSRPRTTLSGIPCTICDIWHPPLHVLTLRSESGSCRPPESLKSEHSNLGVTLYCTCLKSVEITSHPSGGKLSIALTLRYFKTSYWKMCILLGFVSQFPES